MNPPNGLEQIVATFGDICKYLHPDGTISPEWEINTLAIARLAFPLQLSWDRTKTVNVIRCHKLLVPTIEGTFSQLQQEGLAQFLQTFGGCYMFRPQRGASKLSAHCWAIALDLNPESNRQGTPGNMDTRVVQLFEANGFEWGGKFLGDRQDPMHFQFCTGY